MEDSLGYKFLPGIIFQYTLNFDSLFFNIYLFMCRGGVGGNTCTPRYTCGGPRTASRSQFFYPVGLRGGIESSGLVASTVTRGTVWPALLASFHFTVEETTAPPSSGVYLYVWALDPLTGFVKGEFDHYFPETVDRFQVSINNP